MIAIPTVELKLILKGIQPVPVYFYRINKLKPPKMVN